MEAGSRKYVSKKNRFPDKSKRAARAALLGTVHLVPGAPCLPALEQISSSTGRPWGSQDGFTPLQLPKRCFAHPFIQYRGLKAICNFKKGC